MTDQWLRRMTLCIAVLSTMTMGVMLYDLYARRKHRDLDLVRITKLESQTAADRDLKTKPIKVDELLAGESTKDYRRILAAWFVLEMPPEVRRVDAYALPQVITFRPDHYFPNQGFYYRGVTDVAVPDGKHTSLRVAILDPGGRPRSMYGHLVVKHGDAAAPKYLRFASHWVDVVTDRPK